MLSLESPIKGAHSTELFLHDILVDEAPTPEAQLSLQQREQQLITLLGRLKPREQQILRLRFGLDDGRPQSLAQVSRRFGLSRERVRQIEQAALNKLRRLGLDMREHLLEG